MTARFFRLLPSAALLLLLLIAPSGAVADEIELTVTRDRANKQLNITVSPDFFASGCSYVLLGAPKKKKLTSASGGSTEIFSLLGDDIDTTVVAQDPGVLRLSRRHRKQGIRKRTVKLFLMARASCSGQTVDSPIVTFKVKARGKKGLKGANGWLGVLAEEFAQGQGTLTAAFPNLRFSQPTDIQNAGDGTNRLFVLEQSGRILVFDNDPGVAAVSVFLDLTGQISTTGERGLLGVAFHPQYESNGYFYVHYNRASDDDSVIARFSVMPGNANMADLSSELELLTVNQATAVHIGGQLAFGPDGMLYMTFGDGGPQNDGGLNGQDPTTLLGTVLRIDVDNPDTGLNYGIPADNPFAGNSDGNREEIFAYGFRNPFRMSIDSLTGAVYLGDVGQSSLEEIDVVTSGGNYGWSTMEGSSCFNPVVGCDRAGLTLPLVDYDRTWGRAVIGGKVYRGSQIEAYQGIYLFSDYASGLIFGLLTDVGGNLHHLLLFQTGNLISTFGVDESGEVYVAKFDTGEIFKFVPVS